MTWMILIYNVPRDPSAKRLYVWRKLKKLGAMAMQDAAWVLPANAVTREQFRWLAAEIKEMDGEAMVWEATSLLNAQEKKLMEQFGAASEEAYRSILADLKRKDVDLAALSRRYQQASAQDYFSSKVGQRVRSALLKAKGGQKP